MSERWWLRAVGGAVVLLVLGGFAAATELRLPADFSFPRGPGSPGQVVYSHELHAAFADKCTVCHDRLFPILRPTRRVTHAEMEAGKACGGCHNGQMAFGPMEPGSCSRCHSEARRPS